MSTTSGPDPRADRPDVVLILADDLGYGDVTRYNHDSRIPTPNVDRLAATGRTSPTPTPRRRSARRPGTVS
jgi:hypothetical protein